MLSLFQVQLSGPWYLSEPLTQLSVALVFSVFHAGSSLRVTPGSWVGPAGSFQGVVSADKPPVATCLFGTRDIQLRRTRSWLGGIGCLTYFPESGQNRKSNLWKRGDKERKNRRPRGRLRLKDERIKQNALNWENRGSLSRHCHSFCFCRPFRYSFIKLFLLIISNSKFPGHSIKCWVCRSDGDPKCADPFDNRQPPLILQS